MNKRGLWIAACAAALQPFISLPLSSGAAAQSMTRARLISLPFCPATEAPPRATQEGAFGAAALGVLVPKLLSGVNNIVTGLIRNAAQRAKANAVAEATASAAFNFYQYDIKNPALALNPEAGCLVLVQGEFGDPKRGARYDAAPMAALRSVNDAPNVYEYRLPEFGETGANTSNPTPRYFRKTFDIADSPGGVTGVIDTYPKYFQSLGLVDSPNLYIEFAVEPAFSGHGATYESNSHFQLQPRLIWYRSSIGSKGGDRKPSLTVEASFKRAQSSQVFAADPQKVSGQAPEFSIVFRNLPIGSVLGPEALKDIATAPLSVFPLPEKGDADISDAEQLYYARREEAQKAKGGAKLTDAQLTTLRTNRKYFYLEAVEFPKDPLLYIEEYVSLPKTDACAPLSPSAPNPDEDCDKWSVETAKAEAMELAMETVKARDTCKVQAAGKDSEIALCESAMKFTQQSWEVERREAMEILNRFEGERSSRANDAQQRSGASPAYDSFGATIAQVTMVETRDLNALYAAVLEAGEKFELLTSAEQSTLSNAIKGKDAKTRLGETYSLQQKLLLAENAQADFVSAEEAVAAAEANLRVARAGSDQAKITSAESALRTREAEFRKARSDLLAAKGAANVAAFTAGQPLPYPDIGGQGD